jgi:proteasome lid subunit RPN8/RPN11
MDYETILESAPREAGAEFVAAFARDLAHERCEIYEAMSNRTANIVRFQCGTFEYLYDDYATEEQQEPVAVCPVIGAHQLTDMGQSKTVPSESRIYPK